MNTTQISFRHPPDNPVASPRNTTYQQTPTDTTRHPMTQKGAVWVCLASVPWHLLLSAGMACSLETSGGVWGISEWYLWKLEALGCAWGVCWFLSPYSMERKHYLGTALRDITFVAWPYWDIQISKWSHISFPKMVGLCHFFDCPTQLAMSTNIKYKI